MGDEFTVDEAAHAASQADRHGRRSPRCVIVKDNNYVYSVAAGQAGRSSSSGPTSTPQPGKTSYYYVRGTQVGQTTERERSIAPRASRVDVELNNGEIVWVSPMWITYEP